MPLSCVTIALGIAGSGYRAGMQIRPLTVAAAALLCASLTALADPQANRGPEATPAIPGEAPPAEVAAMLAAVSPERMKADIEKLASFGTRHTLSDANSPTRGIGAARRWIKSEFEKAAAASGRTGDMAMRVRFESFTIEPDGRRVDKTTELVNVIAELPGRLEASGKAQRCYVLGHYDSRNSDEMDREGDAPGANDDASGVVVAIELARVMAGRQFDHTIVFMATAGEEQGLIGARRHVGGAVEAGAAVRGALSNDIVGDPTSPFGGRHDDRVRVFSEGLPSFAGGGERGGAMMLERLRRESALTESSSRQLARFVAEVGAWERLAVQAMLVFRADRFLRGGDHTPFHEAGFPAVRFCEVDEDYTRQHQNVRTVDGKHYGDTAEFVDGPYLAGVARLNGAALAHLANAPETPANARIITSNLGNSTTLRWQASPEADTAGYEVVWRETTSPVWQWATDVGNVTEATLPINKDNHFLGVRAYDGEGYRSPVAFPLSANE
jgi:hypothetical protein